MDSSSFSLANVAAVAISIFTLLGTIFFLFYKKISFHQENKTTDSSSLSFSPPSSSSPRNWIHHVFPSFHGADVRTAFLSHVMKELRNKGIDPFIDNDIERSKSIGPELIKAIRGSKVAIVFLSKDYASSTWCLNELVEIMKCREEFGQIVMTLFYQVDPSEVKKQNGDFGRIFKKTCKGKTMDNIRRWKEALEEVAQIAGYHSNNWDNEAKMIEKIVTDVSNELNNFIPSNDFNGLDGMKTHMEKIEPLLGIDSDEVKIIGIWGPSGIGKTSIARFLFDQHSKKFQLSIFMENIKGMYNSIPPCSDEYGVKKYLQKKFLSQITNQKDIEIPNLGIIKDRLQDKKVLVVFDDVDQLVQLQALANENGWFGSGSLVIFTTQDQQLLKAHGINHIYRVDFPSRNEAFEMFCMYAFDQKIPKNGFRELAREVTTLVGELPLGLSVMGSYFRGMSTQEWADALPRLRTRPHKDIESILKISYDILSDEDKNLFRHIACFFKGESVDNVKDCLANSIPGVTEGLRVLTEKSLISMHSGIIDMHNLLVQLGREIVRKQNVSEPRKRQFLIDAKDIEEVLNDHNADCRGVIGIDLREHITWTSERAFERLSHLQFLYIDGRKLNMDFPFVFFVKRFLNMDLPLGSISRKLILLNWSHLEMPCLPSNFHTKFLVKLDMPWSQLEKLWEGIKPLDNLKEMDLSSSRKLKEVPDLSTATNLQKLNLSDCSSLVEIPSSIGNAINLQKLNLSECSSLVKIPSSIGNAKNLQNLDLSDCESLVEIPYSIGNAINLRELDLNACSSLVEIPSSIGNAINLQKLDISFCLNLVEIPSSIGNAINLQKLDISFCLNLVEIPSSIGNAINLEQLRCSHCSNLVEIPSSIGNAINLQILNLNHCSSLVEIPSSIGNATNLQILFLSGCSSLVKIPSSIWNAIRLQMLDLSGCSKLKVFPTNINLESPQEPPYSLFSLDASGCKYLERLDCSFRNPISLNFSKCFKLNQEARDLISHTRTDTYIVLPGGEVPECFTYRSSGNSLSVKLNQKPLRTSTTFKACILFHDDEEYCSDDETYSRPELYCYITSKHNALTICGSEIRIDEYLKNHMYIFEVEAGEVTSTELDFKFVLHDEERIYENWRIKECGIFQLGDGDEDDETSDRE